MRMDAIVLRNAHKHEPFFVVLQAAPNELYELRCQDASAYTAPLYMHALRKYTFVAGSNTIAHIPEH